jgi:hypothetical protein
MEIDISECLIMPNKKFVKLNTELDDCNQCAYNYLCSIDRSCKVGRSSGVFIDVFLKFKKTINKWNESRSS